MIHKRFFKIFYSNFLVIFVLKCPNKYLFDINYLFYAKYINVIKTTVVHVSQDILPGFNLVIYIFYFKCSENDLLVVNFFFYISVSLMASELFKMLWYRYLNQWRI